MRSRSRATPFLSDTVMPQAFSRLTTSARCWAWAKNRACNCQANKPAICRGQSGCKFTIPRRRWSQAQTANVSIGQGYTLVSPLQLAMAYVAIANGGICYYPRLIDKVLKQDGSPVLDEQGNPAAPPPRVRSDLRQEISPEHIELVRKGLWKVVNEDGGTGGRARLKDWVVAGKTGTAAGH